MDYLLNVVDYSTLINTIWEEMCIIQYYNLKIDKNLI